MIGEEPQLPPLCSAPVGMTTTRLMHGFHAKPSAIDAYIFIEYCLPRSEIENGDQGHDHRQNKKGCFLGSPHPPVIRSAGVPAPNKRTPVLTVAGFVSRVQKWERFNV